jgi:ferric-dicitrate binding protein FerR (iron transport regulator)
MGFRKTRTPSFLFQAAAILITLLSVGFLARVFILDAPEMILISTTDVPQEFTLPDGSLVHLNRHSELSYPEKFHRKERSVAMKGEVLFSVSHNPDKPFMVNIGERATVEVLGTSFNINARLDTSKIGVQVVEGRVAFFTNGTDSRTILNKGDQAELEHGRIQLKAQADPNFLSWQTGILYFRQNPIDEVVHQLEQHYHNKIILDPSVDKEITFTSTLDNQELDDVLEEISLVLELIITYNPDTITISKQH